MRRTLAAAITALAACLTTASAEPVPGSFTYQGVLEVDGQPVISDADFIVRLYDGPTLISSINQLNIPVNNGRFTLDLAFSPVLFTGADYDLEFLVRSPAGIGAYQPLSSRQPLSTTPYAYHANTADTLVTPAVISANIPGVVLDIAQANTDSNTFALRATRGPSDGNLTDYIDAIAGFESTDTPVGVLAIARNFPIVGVLDDNNAPSNTAAVLGQIAAGASDGAYAVWALNTAFGTQARLGTSDSAAELLGDLRIDGDITRAYSPGSYDIATPIAYGYINTNGSVANGTPNFSCVWNASSNRYEIEIDNENYFFNDYVTVVTPANSGQSAAVSSSSNRMLVFLRDTNTQNLGQGFFQFVTYKTSGAAAIAGQQRPQLRPLSVPYTDHDLYPNPMVSQPRLPQPAQQVSPDPIKRD